ncbi:MAG: glycosyltransferase family 39 protein [Saprospirales bacterium]|nr:glycosyltransferase family 39 protein [Saprospirales bacterium]
MAFRYSIGYTLLFGLLFMISQYDVWLQLPPASMHQWRQADGASIAWHYAQNLCIGEVQVNNLFYTGDNHAAGELPLLYWLSGLMTRSGLAPDYPLRWIGLFLLFGGGWAFGWMVLTLTGLPLVAALSAGLLLTSPVLSYYGPGFLPDAPAFCFVLIMAACVLQAERRQSGRWLGAGAFFAALAIALKLSMALLPLALAGAWALGRYRGQWPAGSIWNGNSPFAGPCGRNGRHPGLFLAPGVV